METEDKAEGFLQVLHNLFVNQENILNIEDMGSQVNRLQFLVACVALLIFHFKSDPTGISFIILKGKWEYKTNRKIVV